VRLLDPLSGAVRRSHRVTGQVSFDWLGDTRVVGQLEFAGRWSVRSDLWRWAPGGAWQRMTTHARLTDPRAGGDVLASLRLTPGGNTPTLSAPVVPSAGSVTWGPVVPSPHGAGEGAGGAGWLVAPRHRNGRWELVRWRDRAPDGLTVLLEAQNGAVVADPVWTRDGTAVLFVTDVAGFPQIHRWQEGQGIVQVTDEPHGARAPAPLADGRILFSTLGDAGWELRAVEPRAIAGPAEARPASPDFVAAPRVSVRETGYSSWGSLRPHFWIPLVFNSGDAGVFFGAATAGVDAVGRYSYFAQGLISGSPLRA
jgi:hypothetical protein